MKNVARLFTQFQPSEYDVTFDINEEAMRFSGTVTVRGKKVGRPAQRITLHQNGLKITSGKIIKHDKHGDTELPLKRINLQNTFNEVRLHTDTMVYPGEYTLELGFEAPITTGMTGIYPCFFKDGSTDKQLIMTQFESHYAREAFPCIDEPEAKAIFNLSLITRTGVEVLGNTPVKSRENLGERLKTSFEPTPRMSSYLLAFVFGEMHKKSTTTNRGTEVNVWATVAQPAEALDFPLEVATQTIEFFEDYFGVDYPLPKADHVACPDFSAGAMENWGLITYRERTLLVYPQETPQSAREYIASVIAHETSHQWFGNLVTMRWWDDLWINESFANMMEYQAIDALHPEWHMVDQFIAGEGLSALRRDATAGVQAVRTSVHHPDEIATLFDPSIVYAKGGRLLFMLKSYIGDEAFRAGLKNYFLKHQYGNTTGADLWEALSMASGKDIASFMDPWLNRSGFPLVTITQNGNEIELSQEHFLDNPAKADTERRWDVPLFSAQLPEVLSKKSTKLSVKPSEPIVVNSGAKGHYLVRYASDEHRSAVIDLVRSAKLPEPDRLMLLNGASMQSKAGYEPYGHVLEMLDAYSNETGEPVWDIMSLVIGEARRFVSLDETLDASIKPFVSKLVAAQVARLGWEPKPGETSADTKLRALVLSLSAYAEDKTTINKATELFAAYQKDASTVPAELRFLAFLVPIKNGDDTAFDYLLKLHDSTQNGDLISDACDALTTTRQPEKALQLLDRIKNPSVVKPQDADRWLVYLLRNRYTRDVTWDWFVKNWQWFEDTFKNDKSYDILPRYAASCVNTPDYIQKYHALFDDKLDQVLLKRNIQLGFEEIEARVKWLQRDLGSVQEFFRHASRG